MTRLKNLFYVVNWEGLYLRIGAVECLKLESVYIPEKSSVDIQKVVIAQGIICIVQLALEQHGFESSKPT